MIRLPFLPLSSAGRRASAAATLCGALALVAAACSDRQPTGGNEPDRTPPSIAVSGGTPSADTTIAVNVLARDNLGLRNIIVQVRGAVTIDTVITYTSAVTEANLNLTFTAPRSVAPGTAVTVSAEAIDGRGNRSGVQTTTATVGNLPSPTAVVTSPGSGAQAAVAGASFDLTVVGTSPLNVRALGYRITGAIRVTDSVAYTSPLLAERTAQFTVNVPAEARGSLFIRAFVRDSLGQLFLSPDSVALEILSVPPANSRPVVSLGINPRVEATDTINLRATDPAQIAALGYSISTLAGANVQSVEATITGNRTSVDTTLQLNLPVSLVGQRVLVRGFARNRAGAVDSARVGGVVRVDTVLVVAGVTRPLPLGGVIADAFYHPGKNRVYMSNIERNRLEVLNIATLNFESNAIVTGSRPWGIAPWPRDRAGNIGDTLLVANSGGTNVSYINLNSGVLGQPSGVEVYRYPLPNIIVYSVTSERSATTGAIIQSRIAYDFSDRPQWVGTTCQGATLPTSPCADVVLVYSTTPTNGQTSPPFANRGTVRYENLTRNTSHFFYEQAVGTGALRSDTLEIERYAASDGSRFIGSDSILVPAIQLATRTIDGLRVPFSVTINIDDLAFRDTTFVRNSGNFRRAIIGEGGSVEGARSVGYDASQGLDPTGSIQGLFYRNYVLDLPVSDLGISRPVDVSDFIANTFARIRGVSINFDGELAAIRADSTYIIDPALRLQGLLQTSGGNPGMDFHPRNAGRNTTQLETRLAFAASTEPVIELYDTYCFQRVTQIPVRDPIIGPIKAAFQTTGTTSNIVLVGATARGAVVVTLPNNMTTACP